MQERLSSAQQYIFVPMRQRCASLCCRCPTFRFNQKIWWKKLNGQCASLQVDFLPLQHSSAADYPRSTHSSAADKPTTAQGRRQQDAV